MSKIFLCHKIRGIEFNPITRSLLTLSSCKLLTSDLVPEARLDTYLQMFILLIKLLRLGLDSLFWFPHEEFRHLFCPLLLPLPSLLVTCQQLSSNINFSSCNFYAIIPFLCISIFVYILFYLLTSSKNMDC